jgi:predicted nucleic acid-binding protein
MPEGELVVADTSPLLNLALIDRLHLIHEQFTTVKTPNQVWSELMAGNEGVESFTTRVSPPNNPSNRPTQRRRASCHTHSSLSDPRYP